jgi:hypothetical protein
MQRDVGGFMGVSALICAIAACALVQFGFAFGRHAP